MRARNRAADTIQQHLVAIECLMLFCRVAGIEINERIRSGKLLTIGELDGLSRAVRQPVGLLAAEIDRLGAPAQNQMASHKVVPLEAHR